VTVDTNFEITVKPRWWNTVPVIAYGVNNVTMGTVRVEESTTLTFSQNLISGDHRVWILFYNKNYNECKLDQGLDMAVEIESVTFEGMTFDRFKWAGLFYPKYPADYPNQEPVIKSATYLGWNGRWELPFTTPIFTWIHKIENLGWLYEP